MKKEKASPNRKRAVALAKSPRGRYLISQALCEAADTLQKAPSPPWSNIADMLILRDELYPAHTFAIGRDVVGTVLKKNSRGFFPDPPFRDPPKKKMLTASEKTEMIGKYLDNGEKRGGPERRLMRTIEKYFPTEE